MSRVGAAGAVVAVAAVTSLVAACGVGATGQRMDPPRPAGSVSSEPTSTPRPDPDVDPDLDLDLALSEPAEDSVYPDVGDPGVDALHYDLALAWDPASDTLTGTETLTFRSTATAEDFQLDFGEPLEITGLTVDGAEAAYEHRGKDLVVSAPVVRDERYELVVDYAGTPEPVEAPTQRSDFSTTGFTIDAEHQTWTMQEPFGAFTWYAVNDHPSDKAFYDFTLEVPAPWTGVANGEQVLDEMSGSTHTTGYHLAEPAASYLVTLAFGDYLRTEDAGPGGVPITYWTPRGTEPDEGLRYSPQAMAYLEQYLGPYPFDTAGILLVDSESGMETQAMITLGTTSYATSAAVVVHEFAHQWWGDQVTPDDWRDVWMNEGMAMYLQLMWEAEQQGSDLDAYLDSYASSEAQFRREAGPFGDYDPTDFGSSNVYFGGAFMWHELRQLVGDDPFFDAVRGWPASQDNTSSDRETLLAFLEQETGEDLDEFWDAWLLGERTPPRG